MRKITVFILILALSMSLVGCVRTVPMTPQEPTQDTVEVTNPRDNIPFSENQLYAVAYLGFDDLGDLDAYVDAYLGASDQPTLYLSPGDYYLIIPRYDGMSLAIYRNDIETMDKTLVYQTTNAEPLILQCNISDIFADATLRFTKGEVGAEFSPFISLKDGSVDIGESGLLLENPAEK